MFKLWLLAGLAAFAASVSAALEVVDEFVVVAR